MENDRITELIDDIENGKHNLTMFLKRIVLHPIEYMNVPGAATKEYGLEQKENNNKFLELAKNIMDDYDVKWRDLDVDKKTQLDQIKKHLSSISNDIIPNVKKVVDFYKQCIEEHLYYFANNTDGDEANAKMKNAVEKVEQLCDRLNGLAHINDLNDKNYLDQDQYPVLEVIQESLDQLIAFVEYDKEWECSTVLITINREALKEWVFDNIKSNIEEHAFNTSEFQNKHVWEKRVLVSMVKKEGFCNITIANNGTPFSGNPSKLCEKGYCHGEKMHSGIGLYAAKKFLQEHNGDLIVDSSYKEQSHISFTYMIKIPVL